MGIAAMPGFSFRPASVLLIPASQGLRGTIVSPGYPQQYCIAGQ